MYEPQILNFIHQNMSKPKYSRFSIIRNLLIGNFDYPNTDFLGTFTFWVHFIHQASHDIIFASFWYFRTIHYFEELLPELDGSNPS